MANRPVVAEYPAPWFGALPPIDGWVVRHNEADDRLNIHLGTPRPGVSVDFEDNVWLRIDPGTGEVVGIEIEDFTCAFLVRYPRLRASWHAACDLTSKVAWSAELLESIRARTA